MAFLYSTDREQIRKSYTFDVKEGKDDLLWHKLWMKVADKNVTDGHFARYMEENNLFSPEDVIMFKCMRAGILDPKLVKIENNSSTEEDEEELEEDEKYRYEYSIDYKDYDLKDYMKQLVALQVNKNDAYSEDYFKSLIEKAYDKCSHHGLIKINGFERVINVIKEEAETIVRDNLDPETQTAELDFVTHNAELFNKDRREDVINEFENPEEHDAEEIDKAVNDRLEDHGEKIMIAMKGAIYAHRNHNVFYAIFHPFKYNAEAKSITSAKKMLENLGADRKQIDKFEKNVISEDKYLRDKKDYHKAKFINDYTMIPFSNLVTNKNTISLYNDAPKKQENTTVKESESVKKEENEKEFMQRLSGDILGKSQVNDSQTNLNEDVLNTAIDEIDPKDLETEGNQADQSQSEINEEVL